MLISFLVSISEDFNLFNPLLVLKYALAFSSIYRFKTLNH